MLEIEIAVSDHSWFGRYVFFCFMGMGCLQILLAMVEYAKPAADTFTAISSPDQRYCKPEKWPILGGF